MKRKEALEAIKNAPEKTEELVPEEELNMDYVDDPAEPEKPEKQWLIKKIIEKAKTPFKCAAKVVGATTVATLTVYGVSRIIDHFVPGTGEAVADAVQEAAEGAVEAAKDVVDGSLVDTVVETTE